MDPSFTISNSVLSPLTGTITGLLFLLFDGDLVLLRVLMGLKKNSPLFGVCHRSDCYTPTPSVHLSVYVSVYLFVYFLCSHAGCLSVICLSQQDPAKTTALKYQNSFTTQLISLHFSWRLLHALLNHTLNTFFHFVSRDSLLASSGRGSSSLRSNNRTVGARSYMTSYMCLAPDSFSKTFLLQIDSLGRDPSLTKDV